jgi:hypothetical protein
MIDFSVYGISALVLVVVSLSAMYLPAFRATQDAGTAQRIEGVNSRSYCRQPVPSLKPCIDHALFRPPAHFKPARHRHSRTVYSKFADQGRLSAFLHYFWK